MARELITSWGDYQTAIDRLLAIATRRIFIFDQDLGLLHLDSVQRLGELKRVLQGARTGNQIRLSVRDAEPMRRQQPLLMNLLADFSHCLTATQTPDELSRLRDSMILVDDKFGLIRFEQEQPRSKLLIDEEDELRPYFNRFEDICFEGGENISATTLGL